MTGPLSELAAGGRAFVSIAVRTFGVLLLGTLVFWESGGWQEDPNVECSGRESPADQLSPADYNLVTSWSSFQDPNDQMIRIITFDRGKEPNEIISNPCEQRKFLAMLVRKLDNSGASVIALDKRFEATCSTQPEGTLKLKEAVAQSKSRIVIGMGTVIVPASNRVMVGERQACLAVTPQIKFDSAHYGLIRLNSDTRRVPLSWPTFVDDTSSSRVASYVCSGHGRDYESERK